VFFSAARALALGFVDERERNARALPSSSSSSSNYFVLENHAADSKAFINLLSAMYCCYIKHRNRNQPPATRRLGQP
jgi:hypothetical protein